MIQTKRDNLTRKLTELVEPVTDVANWRMQPLDQLKPLVLTIEKLVWMGVLRGYLIIAVCLVAYKVVLMARAQG